MSRRRCGWCGREVEDYLIYEIETDHGADAVVWCTDAEGCNNARTRPRQPNHVIEHNPPDPPRGLRRDP